METLYDIVIIIVDGLTKYAKFILYNSIITIEWLTYLLSRDVFANYNILR